MVLPDLKIVIRLDLDAAWLAHRPEEWIVRVDSEHGLRQANDGMVDRGRVQWICDVRQG